MAFTRNIQVSGVSEINGININISFTYDLEGAPLYVNFYFTTEDNIIVSGSCDENKIINYHVNDGIVSDELLALVETECKRVLLNYETV